MRALLVSSTALLLLASCVGPPRDAPREYVAPPAPVARPAPLPAPAPLSSDWRDWPVTPGDWRYMRAAGGSSATFGRGGQDWTLRLTCRLAQREIVMERPGADARGLTVRTTTLTRAVPASATGGAQTVAAALPVNDPLLDAMGYSRGRFIVEGGAASPLVIPAWPEVLRVVEDCRG